MRLVFVVLLLSCTCVSAQTVPAANNTFDTVIINGHLIDGTGSPWYSGHIGIRDGRIAAIGDFTARPPATIDAQASVVAPGFIDMLGQSELTILVEPHFPRRSFRGSPPKSPAKATRLRRSTPQDRGRPDLLTSI